MNNLAKMSIEELEELLSKITDATSALPATAVLQSKCIRFLSSEIAVLKEALNNNVSKSLKELRDSIVTSTEKIIGSNKKLADSQSFNSWLMILLTLFLVIVGVTQARIMFRQCNVMDKQTKIMGWQLENAVPYGHAKPVF